MAMDPNLVELIGYAAGTGTTLSFLPQLIVVYKHKSAKDVSYGWLGIFSTGVILWLIYGLLLHSWPVILTNALTLSLVLAILALKVRYDR